MLYTIYNIHFNVLCSCSNGRLRSSPSRMTILMSLSDTTTFPTASMKIRIKLSPGDTCSKNLPFSLLSHMPVIDWMWCHKTFLAFQSYKGMSYWENCIPDWIMPMYSVSSPTTYSPLDKSPMASATRRALPSQQETGVPTSIASILERNALHDPCSWFK